MRMKSETVLASICLSIPLQVFAMCLKPSRPCTWYAVHHGQPTFIGTAISEETVPDVLEFGGHDLHVTVQKVTFNVEEPFDAHQRRWRLFMGREPRMTFISRWVSDTWYMAGGEKMERFELIDAHGPLL